MRRVRILASLPVALALASAMPAFATPVTVQISGIWDSVVDTGCDKMVPACVLDGSVTVGGSFAATLVYDDATTDDDPSGGSGAYDVGAAFSDLSLVTGNYSFSPNSGVGIAVENGLPEQDPPEQDQTILFAENYVVTGPEFPTGVGTGEIAFANPILVDLSATAHGSDALIGLNWVFSDFDEGSFYLFVEITGAGALQFIEFDGTITDIDVEILPEPSLLALAAAALIALVALHRRG